MLIFPRGKTKQNGFILLRSLVTLFTVLVCLAAIMASLYIISNRSFALWQNVQKEIEKRNTEIKRAIH
jgi:type II secretory pathway pseudopilin PulG